jgi:hypothetical protein
MGHRRRPGEFHRRAHRLHRGQLQPPLGQALLEAAGGQVLAEDGAPLRYGKPGWRNSGFVATGLPGVGG